MFTTLNTFSHLKSYFKLENRDLSLLPWCLCFRLTEEMETADLRSQLALVTLLHFINQGGRIFSAKKEKKS